MVSWIGFKQTAIHYERDRRFGGNTKFTISKMLRLALNAVFSFSSSPLHTILVLGLFFTAIGFAGFIGLMINAFLLNSTAAGWAIIIIAILFLSGIQLVCTGVIGEYISRIFDEVRRRPLYLVQSVKGRLTEKSENKLKESYMARTGTTNSEPGKIRFFEDLQRTHPR
jgi:dolichol-phosphate mannosyltransferase